MFWRQKRTGYPCRIDGKAYNIISMYNSETRPKKGFIERFSGTMRNIFLGTLAVEAAAVALIPAAARALGELAAISTLGLVGTDVVHESAKKSR